MPRICSSSRRRIFQDSRLEARLGKRRPLLEYPCRSSRPRLKRRPNPPSRRGAATSHIIGRLFQVSHLHILGLPVGDQAPNSYAEKTKIAARIKYELSCKTVDNAETRHLELLQATEAMQPKRSIQFLGHGRNGIIGHGSAAANDAFGTFIVSPRSSPLYQRPLANTTTENCHPHQAQQSQEAGVQGGAYSGERALGPHLQLLPAVRVLGNAPA